MRSCTVKPNISRDDWVFMVLVRRACMVAGEMMVGLMDWGMGGRSCMSPGNIFRRASAVSSLEVAMPLPQRVLVASLGRPANIFFTTFLTTASLGGGGFLDGLDRGGGTVGRAWGTLCRILVVRGFRVVMACVARVKWVVIAWLGCGEDDGDQHCVWFGRARFALKC